MHCWSLSRREFAKVSARATHALDAFKSCESIKSLALDRASKESIATNALANLREECSPSSRLDILMPYQEPREFRELSKISMLIMLQSLRSLNAHGDDLSRNQRDRPGSVVTRDCWGGTGYYFSQSDKMRQGDISCYILSCPLPFLWGYSCLVPFLMGSYTKTGIKTQTHFLLS